MGVQLIFVVETNQQCDSDKNYINSTIKYFYKLDNNIKLSWVYMDGKTNYSRKFVSTKIDTIIKKYASVNSSNESKVFYCVDCDNHDSNPNDRDFLNKLEKYTNKNGFELIWFDRDIEEVYLGHKIDDKQKGKESYKFIEKGLIAYISQKKLLKDSYASKSSNILLVLDQYLDRK